MGTLSGCLYPSPSLECELLRQRLTRHEGRSPLYLWHPNDEGKDVALPLHSSPSVTLLGLCLFVRRGISHPLSSAPWCVFTSLSLSLTSVKERGNVGQEQREMGEE